MQRTLYITILILISKEAYAYLDPGTGGLILNLIIGAIAGILIFISVSWQRINNFFKKKLKKTSKKN